MQLFRQHEFVCIGRPSRLSRSGEMWMERGQAAVQALGLPMEVDVANDPFFGRGGKIVADSQRELKLKFELLIPMNDGLGPTACMSFNYHHGPLRRVVGHPHSPMAARRTPAAWVLASSALTLALLKHHGLDPARWPQSVTGYARRPVNVR